MELGDDEKGIVCVTGGTGYLASWLIMRLLQHGYSVRTTIRSHPDKKKDISFLTNLPGASEKLQIFNADLEQPNSFDAAIEGCVGVFHVAHPIDFEEKEAEEVKTRRAMNATLGILKACLNSKTVKRVVYTSSASTVVFNDKGLDTVRDENTWSDIDFIRALELYGASYIISKTLCERAALEFAEEHGLDLVTLIPPIVFGPFICPSIPSSVFVTMEFILDDVASAHIFLLEYPNAKGRFICSSKEMTLHKMSEYLSAKYPEFQMATTDILNKVKGYKKPALSPKKLLDCGFKFKYGLEEMIDGAIQCCKEKDKKTDISFLTNLPGASEKLHIFNADLEQPDSFDAAIEGCVGVFHLAHPMDFEEKEAEEVKTRRAINGTLGILMACLNSKTVKRVVCTSSASTVSFNDKGLDIMDENTWSDIDFIRAVKPYGASYMISKTLTERAALEFAEKHGLDLVTLIPPVIFGPFICPNIPSSVSVRMAMILGKEEVYSSLVNSNLVHVDDAARAQIFLLEYPNAEGSILNKVKGNKKPVLSSKKLLDCGFKFKYGLEEMLDGAIQCCKEKGFFDQFMS
ncbi:hypothetical protein F0562_014769 [Nyssa sinensis]|uniref:Dihydroflavonol 4-reductase n=1 Tax=Nyssa sinensis TaxID=561372 RepID=A0A5J4ZNQ6_9ASTE|nr:hypothetical protein F0562_014769 [Nyssa sinensis]